MSEASELKQQAVFEAARDPEINISAEDAEKAALKEAQKAGSVAYQFKPDASPESKAAASRANGAPGLHRKPKVAALASDLDDGSKPAYNLPTPSKDGAVFPATPTTPARSTRSTIPGEWADDNPNRWERVGWAPRFGQLPGIPSDEEESMLDHQTLLESKLDDKFFGDWYHNTAVIIFACLSSWVIASLGGGLGWILIIMSCCGTYYRTSIRRVRRNCRDDINREMAKARLETDTEPLEWINSFLVKFWPIYAPVLCETIVNSVDQVLSTSTPSFLEGLRMKTFILGTKPPRLEHVKTYPKSEDDIVLMDWKFSFTPKDVADLTARQIKNKINPKVVLEVRLGKGVISKGLDVIVEDMSFSGLMRVKVKLQIPFPHIERVDICFLERPEIDYVCKPLGGDAFGFDINFIPFLETFIQEQIHANLAPMMYAPNVFALEIAKMLAGNPVDEAIGVLQVTFHGAQGLKNPDKFSGTPDPYATVSINNRQELGRTKTVHENANPRWNETINIIITSLTDALTINVWDYNEFRKDKELGTATFALDQFENDDEFENQQLEVMANGRPRGIIMADIRFFPVLEGRKLEDGTVEPPPESLTGVAKFTVEQAKELDGSKSLVGQLNPYAVLLLNGKEVHISKKLKRTNNPIWPDASKELLITDRKKAKLGLVIKDDRDLVTDPIIGMYQIKLDDLLELQEKGHPGWFNLAGVKTGRAKMQLQWKPVELKGALGTSGGYITPIGVMRLHFKNARDLRNLEAMGKSDPYVRVLLSGIQKGRTVTWKNNLNPDFDEVIYVPMHSTREKLLLEVMDEETMGKDRSLGHIEIAASEYIRQDENGEYMINDQRSDFIAGPLSMGPHSVPKGTLNYTCSFFPTLPVIDPEEEERDGSRSSAESARKSQETSGRNLEVDGRELTRNDLAKKLEASEQEQEEIREVGRKDPTPKIRLTQENLMEYETGLLVFKLLECELSESGCHIEVVMDDMAFPSYTSSKIRSKHSSLLEIGDAIVRELDFSRITLRLIEEVDKKGEGKEDNIIAKLTGSTLDTLRRCLYTPTTLTLRDDHGRESRVTVSLKYLPVKMQLDPSESFNNQGTLRVDVLDAADLPAADRNGYSDPYCKFNLNGKEVYKTDKQKKTLHPAWNEFFEVPIRSRTAAEFEVVVYDWDLGDKPDLLGKAAINLNILEPFKQQEVTLGLDGKSGVIRLKMLFKPDYVTRVRQGSSTFHGTFAAPGKVIGAPVKGVGKGAVFVGGNVVKGATFLGRGFRRRKSRGAEDRDEDATDGVVEPVPPVPPTINVVDGQKTPPTTPSNSAQAANQSVTPHSRHRSYGAQSIHSSAGHSPGSEQGTAQISIVSASDFPPDTKIQAHVKLEGARGKDIIKTKAVKAPTGSVQFTDAHEASVNFPCTADAQFRIRVVDHATFGADDELGEAVFFVDDQGMGGEKVLQVGNGKVVIRSSFMPADAASSYKESPGRPRRSMFGGR